MCDSPGPVVGESLKSLDLKHSRELYSLTVLPLLDLPFHDLGESQSRYRSRLNAFPRTRLGTGQFHGFGGDPT